MQSIRSSVLFCVRRRSERFALSLALLAALAAGCGVDADDPDATQDSAQVDAPARPPEGDASLPGPSGSIVSIQRDTLRAEDALQALFGNARTVPADAAPAAYMSETGELIARWTAENQNLLPQMYAQESDLPKVISAEAAALAADVSRKDSVRFLLAIRPLSGPYSCRVCPVALRVAEFAKRRGESGIRWDLTGFFKLEDAGSYNLPPGAQTVRIGKARRAFELTHGYLHMGLGGTTKELIARVGDSYRSVFSVETAWDNSGACELEDVPQSEPCMEGEASYEPIVSDQEWYDIRVVRSGTEFNEERTEVVSAEAKETYRFSDGEYRKVNQ